MSCLSCFSCSAKTFGLSQFGMARLAQEGITVRQIAEQNEFVNLLLDNEMPNVRMACFDVATRLLELSPTPELFHQRYFQPVLPLTGVDSVDRYFPGESIPSQSVILLYEKFLREKNSDYLLSNLLMGYIKFDKHYDSKYEEIGQVPLEKALYISSSRSTDLLSELRNHPSLIGHRVAVDPITDIVEAESLYDIERDISALDNVKMIIVDAVKPLPFGYSNAGSASKQWLNWIESTNLGELGERTLVLVVEESDYPLWSREKVVEVMTDGVNDKYDVYNIHYSNTLRNWACKVKFTWNMQVSPYFSTPENSDGSQ